MQHRATQRLHAMRFGKVGAAMVVCSMLVSCSMPVVDNKDVERAKETPKLLYKSLSNEETDPLLGKYKNYDQDAILKYTDVRDCLIESEAQSDDPDLRLIDWHKVTTVSEFRICLHSIFSSLNDPVPVLEWLAFHHVVKNEVSKNPIDPSKSFIRQVGWVESLPFRDERISWFHLMHHIFVY